MTSIKVTNPSDQVRLAAELRGLSLSHSQTCLAIQRVRNGMTPAQAVENLPTNPRSK